MKLYAGTDQNSGFTLRQKIQINVISLIGWLLIWLIGSTIEFRVEGQEELDNFRRRKQPVIFSFWHNQIFCQTYLFRFQDIVVMTSRHFDGEYIGRIISLFGYGTARGSSTRGATRALIEMKNHLAQGRDVAFTVDGPRGPLYQTKPGPVFLARKSGAPVVTLHSEPLSFWELKSWDRLRIPKPFTRVLVKFGEPILLAEGDSDLAALTCFQNELDRIKQLCQVRISPQRRRQAGP